LSLFRPILYLPILEHQTRSKQKENKYSIKP
jgi:hypothetical protein